MKRTITPGARTGRVRIPASKSQAHRLLICAALGEEKTEVVCDGISADIAATAKCLSALGAKIEEMETGFLVSPIKKVPEGRCDLYCGESGSTLRFLLPIVGALGAQAVFHREGRLPQRPLAPLDSVLKEHGMTLREDGDLLYCSGQLIGGNYTIAGNVSSQYISGLLMALPLLIRDSLLMVSGPLESAAYVAMTEDALQLSKLTIPKMEAMWAIPGQQRCHLPKRTVVEGDWSNTAFFLCMGALSKEGVTVEGLNLQSSQGDRGVLDVLRRFGAEVTEHGDAVTVRRGALHTHHLTGVVLTVIGKGQLFIVFEEFLTHIPLHHPVIAIPRDVFFALRLLFIRGSKNLSRCRDSGYTGRTYQVSHPAISHRIFFGDIPNLKYGCLERADIMYNRVVYRTHSVKSDTSAIMPRSTISPSITVSMPSSISFAVSLISFADASIRMQLRIGMVVRDGTALDTMLTPFNMQQVFR